MPFKIQGGNCSSCIAPQQGGKRRTRRTTKRNKGGSAVAATLPIYTAQRPITILPKMTGGVCPCDLKGGYRLTAANKRSLAKWKRGEPIGFTMRSSLKAKGLIPRANGKKRVSIKYRF